MNDPKGEPINSAADENAEDTVAFDERANEPDLPFDDVVGDLRRRGKI